MVPNEVCWEEENPLNITTLYKDVDRQIITVCGHLSVDEIRNYKRNGWRNDRPGTNKNGIPIQPTRRKSHEKNH
ncbi:hypothetical protein HMPREF1210_01167 [Paenisporosarcina sp. HGH0030]|nr:hypothetical protein HMPREF1210_01167 [Paenisporosarcina sp. HGH0030]